MGLVLAEDATDSFISVYFYSEHRFCLWKKKKIKSALFLQPRFMCILQLQQQILSPVLENFFKVASVCTPLQYLISAWTYRCLFWHCDSSRFFFFEMHQCNKKTLILICQLERFWNKGFSDLFAGHFLKSTPVASETCGISVRWKFYTLTCSAPLPLLPPFRPFKVRTSLFPAIYLLIREGYKVSRRLTLQNTRWPLP